MQSQLNQHSGSPPARGWRIFQYFLGSQWLQHD